MRKKEKKEKFFSSKAMLPGFILLAALLTACGAKTPGGEAAPETVISDGSAAETTAQTVSQTEEAAIQEDLSLIHISLPAWYCFACSN